MKVIVFPFDNYVRPLIEYEKLWHFEICGLISPMGFGINNMQMYENDKKYIIKSEMSEDNMAEMEALLVVGSVRGFLGKIFHRVASRYVIGFILSGGFLDSRRLHRLCLISCSLLHRSFPGSRFPGRCLFSRGRWGKK